MKTLTNKELKIGGVYSITNTKTGKVYYGNTSNLYKRLNSHITALAYNIHGDPGLREDSKTYSGCDFEFRVLHQEEDPLWRTDLEKAYILMNTDRYNTTPSLVSFTHKIGLIKGKIKYAQTKGDKYTPISLCYKTK